MAIRRLKVRLTFEELPCNSGAQVSELAPESDQRAQQDIAHNRIDRIANLEKERLGSSMMAMPGLFIFYIPAPIIQRH
jgi:hypothetical protein